MFKSPMTRFGAEDKEDSKVSKSSPESHDDIQKAVTVNQHHDGKYSVQDGDEQTQHENLDDAMNQAHSIHESFQNPAAGAEHDDTESHGSEIKHASKASSKSPIRGKGIY